jgi:uncharacterized protein YbbC (DUF1343 family)
MKLHFFVFILLIFSNTIAQESRISIHKEQLEFYNNKDAPPTEKVHVLTGLDVLVAKQLHLITGKNIGLVTNHTGVDKKGIPNYEIFMQLDDVYLNTIFAPEHGFYGNVSAGQKIADKKSEDFPTIFSLYGKTRKPTPEMLEGLDLIIYDMQDVGARFYTYISTMGLVMEAAAEAGIHVIILDRPNPIAGKIEGPILNMNHKSFVGMYPIPIRYGLTCGELAKIIVGEEWISALPELTVIKMEGWKKNLYFNETDLTLIPPSPNIPDVETAVIYPGMCLIEGTNLSEGRGTLFPFKWIGAPWIDGKKLAQTMNKKQLPGIVFEPISFTPVSMQGKSLYPKYENELCHGVFCKIINFRQYNSVETGLQLILTINELYSDRLQIKSSIKRLWGNGDLLRNNMLKNADDIMSLYDSSLNLFNEKSSAYRLYE